MSEETVTQAQHRVFQAAMDGECVTCPVCFLLVKKYRRTFHKQMAKFLISLYHATASSQVAMHIRDIKKRQGEFGEKVGTDAAYLVHWGLVEKSGRSWYKITKEGIDFVRRNTRAPKFFRILCGDVVEESSETVDIVECLSEDFDYDELMKG
jgi:predicted transcriptional regulator